MACTFCGTRKRDVRYLIASPIENVYVCSDCIKVMVDMLEGPKTGARG